MPIKKSIRGQGTLSKPVLFLEVFGGGASSQTNVRGVYVFDAHLSAPYLLDSAPRSLAVSLEIGDDGWLLLALVLPMVGLAHLASRALEGVKGS